MDSGPGGSDLCHSRHLACVPVDGLLACPLPSHHALVETGRRHTVTGLSKPPWSVSLQMSVTLHTCPSDIDYAWAASMVAGMDYGMRVTAHLAAETQ